MSSRDKTYKFSTSDWAKYGLEEAILLQHINYWLDHSLEPGKRKKNGYYWISVKSNDVQHLYPSWNTQKISRLLLSLEKQGGIIRVSNGEFSWDKTKYITTENHQVSVNPIPVSDLETDPFLDIGKDSIHHEPTETAHPSNVIDQIVEFICSINGQSLDKNKDIKEPITKDLNSGGELQKQPYEKPPVKLNNQTLLNRSEPTITRPFKKQMRSKRPSGKIGVRQTVPNYKPPTNQNEHIEELKQQFGLSIDEDD